MVCLYLFCLFVYLFVYSEAMYKECMGLCDFVNEEIRKFSCSALLYLGLALFKVNQNSAALEQAAKKAIEMILQVIDNPLLYDR